MKKHSLFLAFALFTLPTFAQLEKGTWILGGTASLRAFEETFTGNNFKKVENKLNFKIAPNIGYFFANKFNIGLRTAYESSQTYFIVGGAPNRSHNIAIGPFARYYFLNTEKPFNILIDAGYQLGYSWWVPPVDNSGYYNNNKSDNFEISVGPVVFLTENVALELSLGYIYQSSIRKDYSATINKGFNTGVGLQFHY